MLNVNAASLVIFSWFLSTEEPAVSCCVSEIVLLWFPAGNCPIYLGYFATPLVNNPTNRMISFGCLASDTLVVILRSERKHKNSKIPSRMSP